MLEFPVPRPKQALARTVQKGQYEVIFRVHRDVLARLASSTASGVRTNKWREGYSYFSGNKNGKV